MAAAAVGAAVLAGLALRAWQYGVNASLWIDEAALARNILDRSTAELLAPLDYGQIAPPGFLLVVKGFTALFGDAESVLRLAPFLSGVMAVLLVAAIAMRELPRTAAAYATALVALGQPFIYFSAQVKQYASDVTAALVALLAVLLIRRGPANTHQVAALTLVGALLPWMSHPAGIVLLAAGCAGLAEATVIRARERRVWCLVLLVWSASALLAAFVAWRLLSPETHAFMKRFWDDGFAPVSPLAFARWAWTTADALFGTSPPRLLRTNGGLAYACPLLFAAVTAIGIVAGRRRFLTWAILCTVLATLALSLVRIYPFIGRQVVFLLPLLLLLTAVGAHALVHWLLPRARAAAAVAGALLVGIPLQAAIATRPPYHVQPLRPVLEEVRTRWQAGDVAYVDYVAGQAFLYYAPRLGFAPGDYEIGRCARTDRRDYLRQVDRFRGRSRVWIIGTHLDATERSIAVGYLEAVGRRLDSIFVPPRGTPINFAAYARLYDLSDPRRLASATSESHPFQDRPVAEPEWACMPVVKAAQE